MRTIRNSFSLPTFIITLAVLVSSAGYSQVFSQSRRTSVPSTRSVGTGSLTVTTGLPDSVVWINNVRHGNTDGSGKLTLTHVRAGGFPVRVRTLGFEDWHGRVLIRAGSAHQLKVDQKPTTNPALIHLEKGDQFRDQAKNDEAVKEYKLAIEADSSLDDARIGMARCLITLQDFETAENQLQAVLKSPRGSKAEAQTVLANLRRNQGLVDESIEAYRRSLRLANNVSPEAHVGLAIALEEKNDLNNAVREYRIGISQDMDTEPILYYLLGNALEKQEKTDDAIAAYRDYLRLDPQGQYSSPVQSMIDRLKDEKPRM